jgi:RNA polymerase sigma-70 factor (ECF subfamily)
LQSWHFVCHTVIEASVREDIVKKNATIQIGGEPRAASPATRNNEDRLTGVLSRYSPVLYRIAFRKLGNAEDAEDALQDGLLSAFKNMDQFRGQAKLSTWLASIVLNSARMQLRRRLKYRVVSLDENYEEGHPVWAERLEDSGPDAEEVFRRTQTYEILEQLVEKLPARTRLAFRLRVFEGLSTCEAAAALGIPVGTMKARFFRARRQVTTLLRQAVNSSRQPKTDVFVRQRLQAGEIGRNQDHLLERTPEAKEFANA